jgi:hypothetical protein
MEKRCDICQCEIEDARERQIRHPQCRDLLTRIRQVRAALTEIKNLAPAAGAEIRRELFSISNLCNRKGGTRYKRPEARHEQLLSQRLQPPSASTGATVEDTETDVVDQLSLFGLGG